METVQSQESQTQTQSDSYQNPIHPYFSIGGVRINAVTLAQTIQLMDDWIKHRHKNYIVLTGAHGVVEMQSDGKLKDINNKAGLVTPDGMSVVWTGRSRGLKLEKVCASNIMFGTYDVSVERGYKHFFYGGAEGVADKLVEELKKMHPGFQSVGTYCPPFRPLTAEEKSEVVDMINASGADIVWVGVGCPKQEAFMNEFRSLLNVPVMLGVGAGFDFLSGTKPLAPSWVFYSGFEWLFRVFTDPKRMGPRFARVVPNFLWLFVKELFGFKKPLNITPEMAQQ